MKNIGLFFNSNDAIQNEELIKKLKIENPESNFYSNYQSESINYFENKKEFHKDIRPFCKSKIDQLSIEFYKNHTNTPLFNDNFNFWVNLRFNIFCSYSIRLLRFFYLLLDFCF